MELPNYQNITRFFDKAPHWVGNTNTSYFASTTRTSKKTKEEAENKIEEAQAKMNEAVDDTEREEAKKAYEKAKENDQEYNQYQGT